MKEKRKEQKGITLIALIITIIVLLILAMVTIKIALEGGIIKHAENAAEEYQQAQTNELEQLNNAEEKMEQYSKKNVNNKWWKLTDAEKEELNLNGDNGDAQEFTIAVHESDGISKTVSVAYDSQTNIVMGVTVVIISNENGIIYVSPSNDAVIEDFRRQMQADKIEPFSVEKGEWFTMTGSHFNSNDKQYTGPSPIQLSDFAENEIFCKSYLERIIASFNK